jgi:ABC-type multidrug transport system ATPase subunit
MLPNLSVYETLKYAAWTRFPDSVSWEERETRINKLLADFGIAHVKDSPIGGPMLKGISGGQKKRVALAIEVLAEPRLLLLDGM